MNNKVPFLSQVAVLDQYIHSKSPGKDPELANVILDIIERDRDVRRYFFSSRPDPAWIPLLWDANFFSKQPEFEVRKEDSFLAFWEAHEFLLSIASDVPEYLIKHLDNLDNCHDWYKSGAIECLIKLKPETVSTVIPKILTWLNKSENDWALSDNASKLMLFMANKGFHDDAFNLFSALTNPILRSGKDTTSSTFISNESTLPEHSPIRRYKPGNEYLVVLEKLDRARLIKSLEKSIRTAIDKESITSGRDYFKISYWRSAIEDSDQDLNDSAKDSLLRALRDTLENILLQSEKSAQQIIESYLSDDYEIFRRLGLYFLHRRPNEFQPLVVKELMNFINLDNSGIHHEFFLLLQKGLPYLTGTQQEELIQAILQGPQPAEKFKNFVQSVSQNEKCDPEEFRNSYLNHWRKNRLWMIKEYLTGDAQETLNKLVSISGEPEHPEFLSWMSGGFWVQDISPVEEDTLGAMTPNGLYQYIKNWIPDTERRFGPQRISWEGLSGSVAKQIVTNPEKYRAHLLKIASYRPELSESIFSLLTNDNYPISQKNWEIWIGLIEDLIKNKFIDTKSEISKEFTFEWDQTHRSIVQLLKRALQHKDSVLPSEFLPRVRDILLILIYHPDPNMEQDKPNEGMFGHLDPLTISINHVRPMALETLVIYATKHAQEKGHHHSKPKWEETVRDTFTRKLDRTKDPSAAVHCIFGRYLSTFYWLDPKWTTNNIDLIFPENSDEESIWFFVAAWDSFILDSYRSYLLPILRSKYRKAIEYLSKGYQTKSYLEKLQHFAIHVVIEYCLGEYTLDSDYGQSCLLAEFIRKTNPKTRASIANACWLVYRDNPKNSDRFWPRIKAVWEWRVRDASTNNHSSEYDDEIREFGKLPLLAPEYENLQTLWPLLEGLLPHLLKESRLDWNSIEKYLLKEVKRDPVRAIQFYKMMYDQIAERPKWIHHSDEAKELINKAICSGNPEAKQISLNLLDNLLRWGDNTFKELYFAHAN